MMVEEVGQEAKGHPDSFWLWDLEVTILASERPMMGSYGAGDRLILEGEMMFLPSGQGFSIYALGALLPLLAAKQRDTHPNDWMTTDVEIQGPDPHCGARYRITRTRKRWFRHGETTKVALPSGEAGQ